MGGVISKTLAQVVNFKRGQTIAKMNALIQTKQLPQGPYPIISSATKPLAMFNQFNMESNQVVISSHGYAGYVSYQNQPFWATPLCHVLDSKDDQVLNNKFLYYALIAKQNELNDLKAGGAIPFISQGDLKTIKIPIVDLEVQSQIVNALDQLSALCNDLSTGLPAQIANANKQYQYYLKQLLSFDVI